MSKIGRRPINISDVEVKVDGQKVSYKGKEASGEHVLPTFLQAKTENGELCISFKDKPDKKFVRENKQFWGLHRALLANKIGGAKKPFEKQVRITGLGFKVQVSGPKLNFSLGFSHKIDLQMPKGVTIDVDKTGQILTFKSAQKDVLGEICDAVRSLRPPEPYKGTGIKLAEEVIIRKAGKAKA
ncbi:50S ribosomal protein L6 [candidate division TM6 bacterium RIFCSPHIGHO2_12_FULL_32_22]|nr:MAG: 50S ribosomal protein L6 [candidate division TM6 bacterium RIFCSPHIGHO2_12_FULL_32_22]